MKKIILKTLSLFLSFFLLAAALSSCASLSMALADEEERPMKLYELAIERMNELENVTLITDILLDAQISKQRVRIEANTIEQIEISRNKLVHRQETYQKESSLDLRNEYYTLSGYQDGQMYFANGVQASYENAKMKAEISAQEYSTHLEKLQTASGIDLEFSPDQCFDTTCKQTEDGKWIGTYTDFSRTYIDRVLSKIAGWEMLFGDEYSVKNLVITLTASEEFVPEIFDLAFEFESFNDEASDTLPVLTCSLKIKKIDDTEIEKADLSDFKAVDDLCYIHQIQTTANEFFTRDAGEFDCSEKIDLRMDGSDRSLISQDQSISLSFSTRNRRISYDMDLRLNKVKYRIIYEYGTQYVYNGSTLPPKSEEMTDAQARQQIYLLAAPQKFRPENVLDVQKQTKDDTVIYTVTTNSYAVEQALSETLGEGISYLSASSTYSFYVKGEELTKYTYQVDARFNHKNKMGTYENTVTVNYLK